MFLARTPIQRFVDPSAPKLRQKVIGRLAASALGVGVAAGGLAGVVVFAVTNIGRDVSLIFGLLIGLGVAAISLAIGMIRSRQHASLSIDHQRSAAVGGLTAEPVRDLSTAAPRIERRYGQLPTRTSASAPSIPGKSAASAAPLVPAFPDVPVLVEPLAPAAGYVVPDVDTARAEPESTNPVGAIPDLTESDYVAVAPDAAMAGEPPGARRLAGAAPDESRPVPVSVTAIVRGADQSINHHHPETLPIPPVLTPPSVEDPEAVLPRSLLDEVLGHSAPAAETFMPESVTVEDAAPRVVRPAPRVVKPAPIVAIVPPMSMPIEPRVVPLIEAPRAEAVDAVAQPIAAVPVETVEAEPVAAVAVEPIGVAESAAPVSEPVDLPASVDASAEPVAHVPEPEAAPEPAPVAPMIAPADIYPRAEVAAGAPTSCSISDPALPTTMAERNALSDQSPLRTSGAVPRIVPPHIAEQVRKMTATAEDSGAHAAGQGLDDRVAEYLKGGAEYQKVTPCPASRR